MVRNLYIRKGRPKRPTRFCTKNAVLEQNSQRGNGYDRRSEKYRYTGDRQIHRTPGAAIGRELAINDLRFGHEALIRRTSE